MAFFTGRRKHASPRPEPTTEQRTLEELFGERDQAATLLVDALAMLNKAMGAYKAANQVAYARWSRYVHHEIAEADELDRSKVIPFAAFRWPVKVEQLGDLRTRILNVTIADDQTDYGAEMRDAIRGRRQRKAQAEADRIDEEAKQRLQTDPVFRRAVELAAQPKNEAPADVQAAAAHARGDDAPG